MKYSRKVCAHDKFIVVLNAGKDKYLNYETSYSWDLIKNACLHFHDSETLNFFGVLRRFKIRDRGYVRVPFPEMTVLKKNSKIKLKVNDKTQLLDYGSGNMLPVDTLLSFWY